MKKFIFALLVLAFTGINAEQTKTCVFTMEISFKIVYADTKEDTGISGSYSKEFLSVPDIAKILPAMRQDFTAELMRMYAALKDSRKVEAVADGPNRFQMKCTEVKKTND